jgi:hypothetical protein
MHAPPYAKRVTVTAAAAAPNHSATALCPSSARVCHWPLQLGFVSKTYDNTVVMAISPSVGQSSHCSSVTSRKFGVPTWGPITNEAASGYNTVIRFNLCENRLRGSELQADSQTRLPPPLPPPPPACMGFESPNLRVHLMRNLFNIPIIQLRSFITAVCRPIIDLPACTPCLL